MISAAKRKILEMLGAPGNKSQFVAFRIPDHANAWGMDFENLKAAILILFEEKAVFIRKFKDAQHGFVDFKPSRETERWFFYHSNFEIAVAPRGLAMLENEFTPDIATNDSSESSKTLGFETPEEAAAVLMAASGLWSLSMHGGMYSEDMLKPGPKRLKAFFTEELENALSSAKQSELLEKFRRYKGSPESEGYMAATLGPMMTAILAIKQLLKCSDDDAPAKAQERCPKRLQDAIRSLQEVMLFDFQIPSPAGLPEYQSKERFFFLLGKYWEVYRAYLSHYMTAEGGYTPDPLARFIVNLRARISACLERLGNPEISETLSELLPIQLNEDASMYDDWMRERLHSVDQAMEHARLQMGSLHFEMTAQEKLFLDTAMLALENVKKELKLWFSGLMKRAQSQAQGWQAAGGRPDPHQAVGKVETALRGIVRKETQARFKTGWGDFVRTAIGQEAYEEATKRMIERGVTEPDELLHFLYLKDLRTIISVEWSIFNGYFSLPRKRWNELMDIVLKGRTESAHFRPDHLWPEVEQSRLRIACHDILGGIQKESSQEASKSNDNT